MNDQENPNTQNIFINGKAQIIEMLEYMNPDEREKLINNIRPRNPQLADELLESSFSFDNIYNLNDNHLIGVINSVNPAILGIALKGCKADLQRKFLSLAPRGVAEKAFEVMNKSWDSQKQDIKRAQRKIANIALAISKQIR